MHVQKMGEDNKVTGQLDAHNVAVSMQGPGVISLTTTQQQVAPGTESPDHTISVMKDTQGYQSSQVMNVHSGKLRERGSRVGDWALLNVTERFKMRFSIS